MTRCSSAPLAVSAVMLKLAMGAMFLFSAVSKFITLDLFEMYVYSFGILPLTWAFFLSRVLIACELLLGMALISYRHRRFTDTVTILFLLAFVFFLAFAHFAGRSDSCHCFGEFLPMSPVQSMLKNAVMILVMLYVWRFSPSQWSTKWWHAAVVYLVVIAVIVIPMVVKAHGIHLYALVLLSVVTVAGVIASFPFSRRWYVGVALVLTPFVAVFILNPPDNWFYGGKEIASPSSSTMAVDYNDKLFTQGINGEIEDSDDDLSSLALSEGRHLVAFFSPSCGYCRLSAGKISVIAQRGEIDKEKIVYIFPKVSRQESYVEFFEKSRSQHFAEAYVSKDYFIKVTRMAFPVILFVDNGKVVASFAYRDISERQLLDFLKQ